MAFDTHGANGKPWTGFDLDGTLAVYDKWRGVANIGKPVKPMCDLIRQLHDQGKGVKILTARVAPREDGSHHLARVFIARWCRDNLGFVPPITHEKDALMETLYDDRVKAVEQNTGKVLNMAKFKVGDVVSLKDGYSVPSGASGNRAVVVEVMRPVGGDFNYWLRFDGGREREQHGDQLRLANSRAANAKFKVGDKVKSSGMRGVFVVKRVMRAGDFSFDSNLKAEAEKAYANGDVGYEVYDEDDSDEVTYLFEKDDRLTLANSAVRSRNAVVAKALNAARARNASACNGRDAAGLLTVGTKVRFGNGKTGEIVKVKRIYSHGFVEPEYTVRDADGRTFIENEGRFEAIG